MKCNDFQNGATWYINNNNNNNNNNKSGKLIGKTTKTLEDTLNFICARNCLVMIRAQDCNAVIRF